MRDNLETWFFGITTWRVRLDCEIVSSMFVNFQLIIFNQF
jgi:hypothetical protein